MVAFHAFPRLILVSRNYLTSQLGLLYQLLQIRQLSILLFTMKFTLVSLVAVFAVTVSASPAVSKRGCNVLGCITGLAPAIESCAEALIFEGDDIWADIQCFADAAADILDPPSACNGCF
ncbi:hypothetical protein BD410DRAFT_554639 [Rickenella mellea]|uniref:Fungal calcium binding protein domain-containing protein n=1 Tax=Rickenella mellea TaxID=50990 RepID=A0A4Y7PPL0_9AGAM|nr:hypothetical protein BD410DRAFT_554639 [Rickenella mellea]